MECHPCFDPRSLNNYMALFSELELRAIGEKLDCQDFECCIIALVLSELLKRINILKKPLYIYIKKK